MEHVIEVQVEEQVGPVDTEPIVRAVEATLARFPYYLGDVVISLDRARVQAEAVGGSIEDELSVLTVHGVLHLLGYDHETKQQKDQMWAIQSEILQSLGIDIVLPT